MRFHAEHHFGQPAQLVLGAMVDPELHLHLELPDVGPPEVLGLLREGDRSKLELCYTFVGRLDPIARRLVGNDRLRWVQVVEVDLSEVTGRLTFRSQDRAHRLHGEAAITFGSADDTTTRRIDGELIVAVPIVRGAAERSIVDGLLGRLDLEAEAIRKQSKAG